MLTEPWAYAALAVVVGIQVAAIVLWSRRGRSNPSEGQRFDVADLDGGSDAEETPSDVQCGECGAVNAARFQFCRECASQLPGPGSDPASRLSDSSGVF